MTCIRCVHYENSEHSKTVQQSQAPTSQCRDAEHNLVSVRNISEEDLTTAPIRCRFDTALAERRMPLKKCPHHPEKTQRSGIHRQNHHQNTEGERSYRANSLLIFGTAETTNAVGRMITSHPSPRRHIRPRVLDPGAKRIAESSNKTWIRHRSRPS